MNPTVRQAIDELIKLEGGYTDHPSDRGGPTRYGITQAVAREAGYHGDMREFPRHMAVTIYERRYWTQPGFDRVAGISEAVAIELFDAGVLSGPATAVRWLQTALSRLNMQQRLYPDLVTDGVLGRVTLDALGRYMDARRVQDGETVLLRALNCMQGHYMMITVIDARRENEDFLFGWLRARVKI